MSDRSINLAGLIVGILALLSSFTVPEVRIFLGLEDCKVNREEKARQLLDDFLEVWSSEDIRGLERLLSQDFYYSDQELSYQGRQDFLAEKRDIFRRKKWISVTANNVDISFSNDDCKIGEITYDQRYSTEGYSSRGKNRLSFEWIGGEYMITREVFEKY